MDLSRVGEFSFFSLVLWYFGFFWLEGAGLMILCNISQFSHSKDFIIVFFEVLFFCLCTLLIRGETWRCPMLTIFVNMFLSSYLHYLFLGEAFMYRFASPVSLQLEAYSDVARRSNSRCLARFASCMSAAVVFS